MLTIDGLRQYGADVDSGLGRCMNMEAFYLKLVDKAVKEEAFGKLSDALASGDLDTAFEAAHSLKGVTGNLALTPMYDPLVEITELLRSRTEMDYSEILGTILGKRDELEKMCE